MLKKTLVLSTIIIFCQTASAYLGIGESGEILAPGHFQFVAQPQFFSNEGGGTNALLAIDAPWNESSSSRFSIGGGKMSPVLGASYKWIPFPDVDRQPAIGVKTQAWFARYDSKNLMTLQVAPLVSRKVQTDQGLFIPYLAVPFNYTSSTDSNYMNNQFVLGSEYKTQDWPDFTAGAEFALNLKDSFSYILLTFAYQFDGAQGINLKRR